MAAVREGDVGHGTGRGVGVDENAVVAVDEAVPFEVEWNVLRRGRDVAVDGLVVVGLGTHELVERTESRLYDLEDMGFEGGEVGLDFEDVVAVVVFFDNLFV